MQKVEGHGQPKCHALVVLGQTTGESKSCLSEAKQENLPKVLTVGSGDQGTFTGETSAVVVAGNIAGPIAARGDDDKCGLNGLIPSFQAPQVAWL